jgi:hypothetical protein
VLAGQFAPRSCKVYQHQQAPPVGSSPGVWSWYDSTAAQVEGPRQQLASSCSSSWNPAVVSILWSRPTQYRLVAPMVISCRVSQGVSYMTLQVWMRTSTSIR